MRWLRLGIGLYALGNLFYVEFNIFFLLFGLFFMYQALFDTGCGGQACNYTPKENAKNDDTFTEYTEIK